MKRILIIILVLLSLSLKFSSNRGKVVFFNVGQGDSSLIYINDFVILIDTGEYDYTNLSLSKYIPLFRKRIDYLIITHAHLDHYGGIEYLLNYYDIDNIFLPNDCEYDERYNELIKRIDKIGVKLHYASMLSIDQNGFDIIRAGVDCLNDHRNINNTSIIVLLEMNEKRFLFMGDSEKEREYELVNEYHDYIMNIDYLKVGHHCSDTSSSDIFIEVVKPRYVVCSFGLDNRYKHPSYNIIDNFLLINSHLLYTYVGNIVIVP